MTGFCSRTRSNPGFGADAVLVGGVGPMNQDIMRVVHDQKGTIQSTHILSLNDADASGGGAGRRAAAVDRSAPESGACSGPQQHRYGTVRSEGCTSLEPARLIRQQRAFSDRKSRP
jgi:hypothetical protein